VGISNLKKFGVTRQKSSYCINLAEAVLNDGFSFTSLNKLDDYNARQLLMQIKGVGSRTADIYLLMALRRSDIWPKGDIALAKSMKKVKRLIVLPSNEEQLRVAEMWRTYRSVAARMLWQHYIKNNL
jgi:DNA-3-methyladenine glycosylase II